MKKVYLDIDGVLLTKKNIHAAQDVEQLINHLILNFDCYWLTTHCKGSTFYLLKMLSLYFSNPIIRQLEKVKPTTWNTLKTEAIDFTNDFYWLDDYVLESERQILKQNKCEAKLVLVNLDNKNELINILQILQN